MRKFKEGDKVRIIRGQAPMGFERIISGNIHMTGEEGVVAEVYYHYTKPIMPDVLVSFVGKPSYYFDICDVELVGDYE